MSKDILENVTERKVIANSILSSVMNEINGVIGFLGIGSFWENGNLGTHGGSEKDVDLIAVIEDGLDEAKYKVLLGDLIHKKFIEEGVDDLKVDIGILTENDELSPNDTLDPGWLFAVKKSVLICGDKPTNLGSLIDLDFPTTFIG